MTRDDEDDGPDAHTAVDLLDPEAGGPRVCADKCTTCIFLPGNLMHLRDGALRQITDDARDSFITCHKTLPSVSDVGPAVCRGWYDGHGATSRTMRALEALFGPPVEVEPPTGRTPSTDTKGQPMPLTNEEDAAEDVRERAASEALLTGAPAAEDVAYWCETVAAAPDTDATREAIERVTGLENPGLLLRVAAELWLSNPDALSLKDLDELEYLDIVLAVRQAWTLPAEVHRAASQLREKVLSRWGSKAEAATDVLENCLGEGYLVNAGIADRHRLTADDVEQIDRDATGGSGVSIIDTDDGWHLVFDCTD